MLLKEYEEKCNALFKKARMLEVDLIFEPENFHPDRLHRLWHGGTIALIHVNEFVTIEIAAIGDVYASYFDKNGNEVARVKDKSNGGYFESEMLNYIKTDQELITAMDEGLLELDDDNWIEFDGIYRKKGRHTEVGEFVDLGMIYDNLLDDDILTAIDECLDRLQEITETIIEVVSEV